MTTEGTTAISDLIAEAPKAFDTGDPAAATSASAEDGAVIGSHCSEPVYHERETIREADERQVHVRER